jgi:DNA-binding GntR family transcriptional regulator
LVASTLANDRIYAALRKQILAGERESDTPLRETELAREFGVSRTPVREALRQLLADQLIRVVPNAGAFVGSMSWEDATETFAIREVLEAFAGGLAAAHFTDEDLAALDELLDDLRAAARRGDSVGYVAGDEAFHALINDRCGNRRLAELIRDLNDRTKLITLRRRTFQRPERLEASIVEHERIAAAIRARDSDAGSDLVWKHGHHFFETVTPEVAGRGPSPLTRDGRRTRRGVS